MTCISALHVASAADQVVPNRRQILLDYKKNKPHYVYEGSLSRLKPYHLAVLKNKAEVSLYDPNEFNSVNFLDDLCYTEKFTHDGTSKLRMESISVVELCNEKNYLKLLEMCLKEKTMYCGSINKIDLNIAFQRRVNDIEQLIQGSNNIRCVLYYFGLFSSCT